MSMRIGWVVAEQSETIASTRYRCYYPAIALEKHGVESRFYRRAAEARVDLPELDVVVLVKRVDDHGPMLAGDAHAMGKRVIIDLCDNVVVPSYEKTPSRRGAVNLAAASVFADAIVTPSPALADAVRALLPVRSRFVVVPDQIETRESMDAAKALSDSVRAAATKAAVQPAWRLGDVRRLAAKAARSPRQAMRRARALVMNMPARGRKSLRRSGKWFRRLPGQVLERTAPLPLIGKGTVIRRSAAFGRLLIIAPGEAARVAKRKLGLLPLPADELPMPASPPAPLPQAMAAVPAVVAAEVAAAAPAAAIACAGLEAAAESSPQRRTVLWFGNYGAPHSDFGMLALLQAVPALEAVARDIGLELVVISNNIGLYDTYIAPAGVPSRYVEWSSDAVFDALRTADVCLLPFGHDDFSVTKSANRAVLALAHGVPVVASGLASFEPLAGAVVFDDWEGGLRRFLGPGGGAARNEAIAAARPVLDKLYSERATAEAWRNLISAPRRRFRLGRMTGVADVEVGVVLNLAQDLDLLLPIIDELRVRPGVAMRLIVVPELVTRSRRVLRAIIERGIVPYAIDGAATLGGDDRVLRGLDALLTAAETSLNPHRFAHALTKTANSCGIETYTLQHGLENVGLSYFDDTHGSGVTIAARHILTWADPAFLPAATPPATRVKCRAIGRTSQVRATRMPEPPELAGRPLIGVFENLHWHRYSEAYRAAFMADLKGLARARPDCAILVKPHHAGLYLIKNPSLLADAPANLILADLRDSRWEPYTAPALIPLCKAVITTPSTVALDAAELDVAVAVARYDLELPMFRGLPQLADGASWLDFVDRALTDPVASLAAAVAFRDRARMPGDAAWRVAELMTGGSDALDRSNGRLPQAIGLPSATVVTYTTP